MNDELFKTALQDAVDYDDVVELEYLLASHIHGEKNLIDAIAVQCDDENLPYVIWSLLRTNPDFDINFWNFDADLELADFACGNLICYYLVENEWDEFECLDLLMQVSERSQNVSF